MMLRRLLRACRKPPADVAQKTCRLGRQRVEFGLPGTRGSVTRGSAEGRPAEKKRRASCWAKGRAEVVEDTIGPAHGNAGRYAFAG
jgi:hypothetical protein